LIALPRI